MSTWSSAFVVKLLSLSSDVTPLSANQGSLYWYSAQVAKMTMSCHSMRICPILFQWIDWPLITAKLLNYNQSSMWYPAWDTWHRRNQLKQGWTQKCENWGGGEVSWNVCGLALAKFLKFSCQANLFKFSQLIKMVLRYLPITFWVSEYRCWNLKRCLKRHDQTKFKIINKISIFIFVS